MKILAIPVLFLVFALTLNAQDEVRLKINSKLPTKYAKQSKGYLATAAAQMFPYVELTIKKVTYRIAFDEDDRKIKYIQTFDKDFVDSKGWKVGQAITVKYEEIEELGYFQLRLKPDKNGWQVVLGGGYAIDRDLITRIKKDGTFTTTVASFAKGYNY